VAEFFAFSICRCINHLDELSSAHSLAFDVTGQHLYAGLKNELRIFDVSVPGRKCVTRKTWSRKTEGGLHGIISCIAVSVLPIMPMRQRPFTLSVLPQTNPALASVYALGSFSRSVGVYLEPRGDLLCLLTGQRGGITQLQFSPDGNFLLAGARKDNEILVWDMRNPGKVQSRVSLPVSLNEP
jgi:WD40 repeat protein